MTTPDIHVHVEHIMGTAISIHIVDPRDDAAVRDAVRACVSELRDIDRVFSPYRAESDISRIRAGDLRIQDADPRVAEVAAACADYEHETGGLFSASWRGGFDPTGYVKGWAVEHASRRHLAPLLVWSRAVGINAGGDLQLFTAQGSDWVWDVGIADPCRPGSVVATMQVTNGAVATSGPAERGRHIIDPRTGHRAHGIASVTVVADTLAHADVWATAAIAAGSSDTTWIAASRTRTGLLVTDTGATTRWIGSTPVEVTSASSWAA
ncbi:MULTISPECIES: FAD:protein FMN transferase [unclassified Microbacterium]|uniref:FAD:protein FMN transferase n=1 Tax=Microbacterium TaxID=33882 RepID=UPI000D0208C1|nr:MULTISPECIES: FAD:protein FMN transferase [unclassified Microbacterium]AVL97595.1 FAD:protein FMN transferase [Microbacterium sp. str. 'China']MDH5134293.1 FAD:protein FMN transferase [Microbacterium sp. RD10]MDH5138595.1 FAD:protein FMN transferase [Microbacterium sp. RD11]MDH5145446.1 FAD:protein FMN transferase [Microbacterium sp. RD12]MDH5156018.1 FAD:protein FMN transferase [Microbacterium sp. RD06]